MLYQKFEISLLKITLIRQGNVIKPKQIKNSFQILKFVQPSDQML